MRREIKEEDIFCSFCGKHLDEVAEIIVGPGVHICRGCIMSCYEAIDKKTSKTVEKAPTPAKIYKELNRHVISQEKAKKALSVAVYNHYKRVIYNKENPNSKIEKSNILMLGPTGTGKTLLAQTIANYLDVPFTIVDASSLTEAGYVGEDVESILKRLFENAEYDIDKTERGIIYIDEFDKIASKSNSPSITRDVSGEGVQHALLKILEGSKVDVEMGYGDTVQIDTKDILFICGGAFSGLKKSHKNSIGFGAEISSKEAKEKSATTQDFLDYGIVPEALGRLQTIIELKELTRDDLVKILTEPANAITKQYQKLFELDNTILEFQKDSLYSIADEAIKKGTGARGLRSIIEEILLDTMFEIPSGDIEKCIITPGRVKKYRALQKKAIWETIN